MKKVMEFLKKKPFIIGISVIILIFVIVLMLFFSDEDMIASFGSSDGALFQEEYEKLNGELTGDDKEYPEVNILSNNPMKYSTVEEILPLFSDYGDAVIYFGYAECLYCRTAVQVLLDVAKETELDTIYYINTLEQGEDFVPLYEVLGEELVEKVGDTQSINAPLVIFVVDGAVVSYNKGTLFSQTSPYDPLDEWQNYGLSEIYQYGIRDVLNSIGLKKEAANN